MSAQPNFTFSHPLRWPGDAPSGEAPPRVWYVPPVRWAGRIFLTVVRGVPFPTGRARWICYGPAGVTVPQGLRITCAPSEIRRQCVLMLLQYADGTLEWMPQGRSLIERDLLPQPPARIGEASWKS